ncbi:unnamed protein product [Ectocarpus fasciculatus]
MRASLVHRSLTLQHLLPGFPVTGCVASREDHGYLVSAGMNGVIFFLPYKAVPDSIGGRNIPVGKPIDCIVESVNESARSVTLRAHPKAVSEATAKGSQLSFLALRAGMLVNAVVEKVVQNGLIVNFLGLFHGVIDSHSLPRPVANPTDLPLLAKGTVQLARIVFVNHATKSVRLSLRPHVVDMRAPRNLPDRGALVTDLSVLTTDKKVGVILSTRSASEDGHSDADLSDNDDDGRPVSRKEKAAKLAKLRDRHESVLGVFVHRSSLAAVPEGAEEESGSSNGRDTVIATEKVDKVYRGLSDVQVRVIGYHLVEGWAVASNLKSYMHSEVVHSSQLEAGQLVDTEVAAVRDFGLVVLVGGKVRAVCPAMHLTEVGILGGPSPATAKAIAKKFKVGQKIKMRVWECSGDGFVLTNKKSLVEDTTNPVLASYGAVTEGVVAKGVVSKVSDEGLRVHFYNKVVGTVPMSVLVQQGVHDVDSSYRQGQIVSCIVLGKSVPKEYKGKGPAKAKPKLTLGLDIGDTSATMNTLRETSSTAESGAYEIVSGIVVRQDDDALFVQLSNDKKSTATLMKCHLTDNGAAGAALASSSTFAVGSKIEEALVLSSVAGKNGSKTVHITMKPLLLQVARAHNSCATGTKKKISEQLAANTENGSNGTDVAIPSKASELSPGQIIAGTIWKVESYGVLIKFRDNLTALVPRTNLADRFVPTPVGLFEVGDSVRCAVQRVDYARDRVIATFKSAFVPQSSGQQSYLLSKLEEEYSLATASAPSGGDAPSANIPDWRSAQIGSVVTGSVVSVRSYGLVLQLANGTSGSNTMMLARGVGEDTAHSRGDEIQCVVLDIDLKNRVFDVTIDADVVQQVLSSTGAGAAKKNKKSKQQTSGTPLEVGQFVKGTVVLLKDTYICVMTASGVVGYAQVADYHCPKRSSSEFSLGQQVTVRVEQCSNIVLKSDLDSIPSPYGLCAIFTLQSSYDATSTLNTDASVLARRVQHEAEQADEELHSKLADPVSAKQRFMDSLRLGAIMRWDVLEVTPLELQVAPEGSEHLGINIKASVHVSGAMNIDFSSTGNNDTIEGSVEDVASAVISSGSKKSAKKESARKAEITDAIAAKHPFHAIKSGDKVTCRVTQVRREDISNADGSTSQQVLVYLSLKNDTSVDTRRMVQWKGKDGVKAKVVYPAVIVNVEASGVVVALSPYVSTRISYMDISKDQGFIEKFKMFAGVGMVMLVCVTKVFTEGKSKTAIEASRLLVEDFVSEGGDLTQFVHGASGLKEFPIDVDVPALKVGQTVEGVLNMQPKKTKNPPAFVVNLPYNRAIRVCVTEFAEPEDWVDLQSAFSQHKKGEHSTFSHPQNGSVVSVRILSVSQNNEGVVHIEGSMRDSRLNAKKKSLAIAPASLPSVGELVSGYVTQTTGKGCFVRLSKDLTAQIQVKNLSDDFIQNPSQMFRMGKLVKNAKVMEVMGTDASTTAHVHLSLKSADTGQVPESEAAELAMLHKGMVVTGRIQSIAACGVFVAIDKTNLVGLSRPPVAVSGGANADLTKLNSTFDVDEPVRALVMGISGRKISLGLKPSLFEEDGEDGSDDDEVWKALGSDDDSEDDDIEAMIKAAALHASDDEDSEGEVEVAGKKRSRTDDVSQKSNKLLKTSAVGKPSARNVDESDDESEDEGDRHSRGKKSIFGSGAQASANDSSLVMWDDFQPTSAPTNNMSADGENSESDSDDSGSEDEGAASGGKKSRQKVQEKRAAEEKLRAKEKSLLIDSNEPTTTDDFERKLLAEPNSSYYWVRYMAMHLMAADVESARRVATRALRVINFREEQEKYNVWVAYVNLEHKYGTMSSLDEVFKRAVNESKGKYLHLHLADLYESSSDISGAESVFELALKRPQYKKSKKVWMAYQDFKLRNSDADSAKKLLQRSLQSLSKHKHVPVLLHYCQSEFEFGSADRARVLYEELLSNYPKRTDIWHVYVDREIKNGHISQARGLFQRMINSSKASSRNMKAIFKKYLNFEIKHGTKQTQESVKEAARAYVQRLA